MAIEAEAADDGGGEGKVGCRKPPGAGDCEAVVMEKMEGSEVHDYYGAWLAGTESGRFRRIRLSSIDQSRAPFIPSMVYTERT